MFEYTNTVSWFDPNSFFSIFFRMLFRKRLKVTKIHINTVRSINGKGRINFCADNNKAHTHLLPWETKQRAASYWRRIRHRIHGNQHTFLYFAQIWTPPSPHEVFFLLIIAKKEAAFVAHVALKFPLRHVFLANIRLRKKCVWPPHEGQLPFGCKCMVGKKI